MELTLEEARRLYEEEASRKESLETRAGAIIAANGAIFTLLTLYDRIHDWRVTTVLIALLLSTTIAAWTFRLKPYKRPHAPPGEFYAYARMDPNALRDQFLLNYISALEDHSQKNDGKGRNLMLSIVILIIALAVLAIASAAGDPTAVTLNESTNISVPVGVPPPG